MTDARDRVWVFGYGSLLWKTNFPYRGKVVGYVRGYARRFWQGSTDHRGVPGAPGRVVTLVEALEAVTWGIAYQVYPSEVPEVMAYLNHREKCGYTTHTVCFQPRDDQLPSLSVLVYIGTEANPSYLGPASVDCIARQVAKCKGPSGCNVEYVLNLARAMREIAPGVEDEHLFQLEAELKGLLVSMGSYGLVCTSCEYHSVLL